MFSNDYSFVSKEEGGYVNDPSDSGGATHSGVTQATYDLYRKRKGLEERPVRYSTSVERAEIFEGIYKDCRAADLPLGLSLMHFDYAVNAGNNRAAKTLQECVGVEADGKIGPLTLAAVEKANVRETIILYATKRREFYTNLAKRRPKDAKFLKGWLLRTDRCEKRALSVLGPEMGV